MRFRGAATAMGDQRLRLLRPAIFTVEPDRWQPTFTIAVAVGQHQRAPHTACCSAAITAAALRTSPRPSDRA